jgi:hypothetical protein
MLFDSLFICFVKFKVASEETLKLILKIKLLSQFKSFLSDFLLLFHNVWIWIKIFWCLMFLWLHCLYCHIISILEELNEFNSFPCERSELLEYHFCELVQPHLNWQLHNFFLNTFISCIRARDSTIITWTQDNSNLRRLPQKKIPLPRENVFIQI